MYKVNLRGCKPSYYSDRRDAELVYNSLFINRNFRDILTLTRITPERFLKELTARRHLFK